MPLWSFERDGASTGRVLPHFPRKYAPSFANGCQRHLADTGAIEVEAEYPNASGRR